MLDLMQQELDFSRGEALTLASLTVDLIRRPAFTYRSSSVPGKREVPIGSAPAEICSVREFSSSGAVSIGTSRYMSTHLKAKARSGDQDLARRVLARLR